MSATTTDAPAESGRQDGVPARSIALLAFAAFVSGATIRVADPLLPQIGRDFGVTTGAASVVVTAFAVSYGLLQMFFGPIGDRFGKYRTAACATLLSAIGTAACAWVGTLESLTAARLVAGGTAAAIIPMSMAWIGDTVPYAERQAVLARFLSGQILGVVFGQAAGGMLGEHLGWRNVFLVLAAFYVVAGTALLVEMARDASARTRAAAAPEARRGVKETVLHSAALLRRPWVRVVLLTVFLEGIAVFGTFAFVASDLQHRFGLGAAQSGLMVAAYGFGGLFYAAAAPWLVARLGERGLVRGGGLVLMLAYGTLALMGDVWMAPFAAALAGLGFYMLHNTLQMNATQMAPEARGVAVALFASCLFMGQTVGAAGLAGVFDRFHGLPIFAGAAVMLPLLAFWFAHRLKRRGG
ncbi:MFS transporter [Chelatococcus sp. SYSU_G07232]|uniref:MFS transporter n=1 Tax=Chelatococcus albus TaxID=3047466 RepID=A0ABT7AHB4_9HYPH|nr:MFS transporter [Chelatococcus sp. SYSU_G07232]MDJ1158738.1 MFS transporter [Chelatococcus sp. SYSU_G07232]